MTDRALLSAAAHAIRTLMKRRQATEQAGMLETDPSAWALPDPEFEALAVGVRGPARFPRMSELQVSAVVQRPHYGVPYYFAHGSEPG
ncbi:hypothetical protein QNM97_13620 [Gordonia sp. L191]|uniref:hypothetical protein n=1 Tax=Gordonia sp. L191 TaxID=2982699 RepID=UPI0024C0BD9E|nr:hypothetical protein [Gordonia sp. L191]WHU45089.1 hypothetical protein QNM97_13620 [Gordonia sp. L191]